MFKNRRTGASFPMPSDASARWTLEAVMQLTRQIRAARGRAVATFACGVNVRALVYRQRDVGDLDNYLTCIGDALQKAGVLANDKQIEGWDGSRKLIDRARPRVELHLTPL